MSVEIRKVNPCQTGSGVHIMCFESSPLMLKHSFRTEQELRWKEKAPRVRPLGFFDCLFYICATLQKKWKA